MRLLDSSNTGTVLHPQERFTVTRKGIDKICFRQGSEVRVRVAECLAAVASCSAGFNTISSFPCLRCV